MGLALHGNRQPCSVRSATTDGVRYETHQHCGRRFHGENTRELVPYTPGIQLRTLAR